MFKKRINTVLAGRKMHVWGASIGLKGTLISNMFSQGKIPGPRQLQKIARAENVRIDWLLGMDDGPPYKTRQNLGDDASAHYIRTLVARGYEPVLLVDDSGHACCIATKNEQVEYDDDTHASFVAVEILPNIGEQSVAALESVNTHYMLTVPSDLLSKMTHGWVSSWELTKPKGILSKKQPVGTRKISEVVDEYSIDNSTAEDIIRRSGQLAMSQKPHDPLSELYVLLDVVRYLNDERNKLLMSYARDLAAEQLANEYEAKRNNTPN